MCSQSKRCAHVHIYIHVPKKGHYEIPKNVLSSHHDFLGAILESNESESESESEKNLWGSGSGSDLPASLADRRFILLFFLRRLIPSIAS